MLWIPLQGGFVRLLAVAANAVLAVVEHPRLITALTSSGDRITLHGYLTGSPRAMTFVNFDSVHVSVAAALALALSAPLGRWPARLKACGIALALVFLVMLAVCVVQVETAAESYAFTRLGLAIHTARQQSLLDWANRKSSFLAVFVLPASLFLASYVFVRSGAERIGFARAAGNRTASRPPARPDRAPWRTVSLAAAGIAAVCWLLAPAPVGSADRVDLQGLRKIVDLNPASSLARFNLGRNLEKAGRLDDALDAYQNALRIDPSRVEASYGVGNVAFAKGAYDRAARSFEDVLRLRPHDTMALHGLANTYVARGRLEDAARAYGEILATDPDQATVHRDLGLTLMRLDRPCEALAHLERSSALDPELAHDELLARQVALARRTCVPREPG